FQRGELVVAFHVPAALRLPAAARWFGGGGASRGGHRLGFGLGGLRRLGSWFRHRLGAGFLGGFRRGSGRHGGLPAAGRAAELDGGGGVRLLLLPRAVLALLRFGFL